MPHSDKIHINSTLAQQLIATQFPQLADLPIKPVEPGGWDNRTFRLGEHMNIRLPSAAQYASKIEKEYHWLPKLAPLLPLTIPTPLAVGRPTEEYPFPWSIYQWIDGETASINNIADSSQCAIDLATFLIALQHIDSTGGPIAGQHNFYRGGNLKIYNTETQLAIKKLKNQYDTNVVQKIWNKAINSQWNNPPVWIHGDISPANLLVKNGKLIAVIDFGGLGIGDPACDLAIAWTFFNKKDRNTFRTTLAVDNATWERARGWALWKALIIVAQLPGTNPLEIEKSQQIIDEIINDDKPTFYCHPYQSTDFESILTLFHNTVHTINIRDYSPEQINVWASSILNKEKWAQLLSAHFTYVVEINAKIVGFADMTKNGSLKHLYVDKDFQRHGIASLLLKAIEQKAQTLGLNEIITESSITAKPFFEKRGFIIIKQQKKIVRGACFINYIMKKMIQK